jgi:hypothetical protein
MVLRAFSREDCRGGVYEASGASAALVPRRIEHEVIDDELATAAEEGFEILLAMPAVEDIVLFELLHGKAAPLGGIDTVVELGEFLFLSQEFLALDRPLSRATTPVCAIAGVAIWGFSSSSVRCCGGQKQCICELPRR